MPASTALVNTGRAIITNRIIGAGTEPKYLGVGTGSATVTLADSALGTEVESRATCTSTRTTTSSTNDTVTWVGTVTAGTARVISEVGLFDASTSGTLFIRGVLGTTATLAIGDTITVTTTLQATSSVI